MTFDETVELIEWARKLSTLTGDPMFNAAIKELAPLLASVESSEFSLSAPQQNALAYVKSSQKQYYSLFGYPSVSSED